MQMQQYSPTLPATRAPHTVGYGNQSVNMGHLFNSLIVTQGDTDYLKIDLTQVASFYNITNPRFTVMYASPSHQFLSCLMMLIKGLTGKPAVFSKETPLNLKVNRINDGTWAVTFTTHSSPTSWGGTTLNFTCGLIDDIEFEQSIVPMMKTRLS